MASKFHLKTASNGQFHFNLHAGNGEIILSSEQYKAKQSALDGIESVRKNSQRRGCLRGQGRQQRQELLRAQGHQRPGGRPEPDVRQRSQLQERHRVGEEERAGRDAAERPPEHVTSEARAVVRRGFHPPYGCACFSNT